jgi:hypothetical protein
MTGMTSCFAAARASAARSRSAKKSLITNATLRRLATFDSVSSASLRLVPGVLGREAEDLADHAHHVLVALLGRHELLDHVGREDQPHAVVVLDRAEGAQRADLRGDLGLARAPRAELLARGHVDDEHHRHLALFVKTFTKGSLMRAETFQSIQRTSSPGWYARTSRKERPWPLNTDEYVPDSSSLARRLRADLDAAQLLQELGGSGFDPFFSARALLRAAFFAAARRPS